MKLETRYDAVVVGSGHNGLVAAAYLARAGQRVLVLEQNDYLGGATTSKQIFPGYEARLSRYAYLVSLFPQSIRQELGLSFETRRRETASFTPYTDSQGVPRGLVLSNVDANRSRESLLELTASENAWSEYQRLLQLQSALAELVWPTLLQPLRAKSEFVQQLKSEEQRLAWDYFVERPLGEAIERFLQHDVLRGLVMTDAKIGVFTHPHDESLLQNRCFLYHVIGGGTGEWQVPVGGMQSLVDSLVDCCLKYGVTLVTGAQAHQIHVGQPACVEFSHLQREHRVDAQHVLVNASPQSYHRMLGTTWSPAASDEGSAVKINMLLTRLPKVRASSVSSQEAFAGSFHIDEGYDQMRESYTKAAAGEIPVPAPGEIYCHTLTDPSILSPELQQRGFQTLTLFGLDMPYRLFQTDHDQRKETVKQLYLAGLDRICVEPFSDCLARDSAGNLCIEVRTPQELESEVGLDLGNIFHNTLTWFYAEQPSAAGQWGVETEYPNIFLAGSSAYRGGAVSGIPGHNAAKCILERVR